MLHGMSMNRSHHVDEPGHYGLLLMRLAHTYFQWCMKFASELANTSWNNVMICFIPKHNLLSKWWVHMSASECKWVHVSVSEWTWVWVSACEYEWVHMSAHECVSVRLNAHECELMHVSAHTLLYACTIVVYVSTYKRSFNMYKNTLSLMKW